MARKKILQDSDGQLWPITRVDCVYTTSGTQLDSYITTELGKKSDSGHTHNYAGSGSAGGTANSAAKVDMSRITGTSNSANYSPGANRLVVREYGDDCTNMPSAHWYHIYTGQGSDAKYNTQLAVGMTTSALYFRNKSSDTWGSWNKVSINGHTHDDRYYTESEINSKITDLTNKINAKADSSHTHSYIPLSGSTGITGIVRSNSEIQTTSANAFRAVNGGYGFFIRNDGSSTYFMLTNKDDAYGNWNSLRPLYINNDTGNLHIGSYTNFGNNIRMGANNTYIYGTNTSGTAVPLLRLTNANVTDVGNTSGITCLLGNGNPTYYNGSTTYTLYHTGNKPSPADIGAAAASHGAHIPTYCNDVGDWNGATYNGWFMGYGKANAPQSDKWYMGFVIAHNSNYVVQTLYDFTSGGDNAANMITWQRVKYNGTWGGWKQVFNCGGDSGNYWNKNVTIGGDGVTEVGKYIDFHVSNGATTDNDGRFTLTSANNLHWNGNLAAGGIMESGSYAKIQGTPLSIQSNAPGCGGVWIQI